MNTVRPKRDPGRGYAYGAPAFIGGNLVGSGLGMLLDDFFAWFLIGMGGGFILMGFIPALGNRRRWPWQRLQAPAGAGALG